ncbi:MAG: hypothetical protein IPM35_38605 [Myxococcales bacterium]|nr:hypothetical protein [Myxococcales bacterium]
MRKSWWVCAACGGLVAAACGSDTASAPGGKPDAGQMDASSDVADASGKLADQKFGPF